MTNENEIKRAFAMEVIEKIEKLKTYNQTHSTIMNEGIARCIESVYSLLPKEDKNTGSVGSNGLANDWHPKIGEKIFVSGNGGVKGITKEEEVDWSKASDEELLSEADLRYPENTVFKEPDRSIHNDGWVCKIGKSNGMFICNRYGNYEVVVLTRGVACFVNGKWADIESKPEIVEPETKTESDEVKDDSDKSKIIEIFENHFDGKGKDAIPKNIICAILDAIKHGRNPEPTLEQKARKKAKELDRKYESRHDFTYHDVLTEALLIDPKTL